MSSHRLQAAKVDSHGVVAVRVSVFLATLALLHTTAAGAKRKQSSRHVTHKVEKGQTLWEIARRHGCTLEALRRVNQIRGPIRPGQQLAIPRCKTRKRNGANGLALVYHVVPGDTLQRIARRYDCSVEHLKAKNRLRGSMIYPGQRLRLVPGRGGRGRPVRGQSIGLPHRGKLVGGMQLRAGKTYFRRRPHRSWGATHVVHHVQRVANIVRQRFPKLHALSIGDLSAKNGGHLAPHVSHQTGRDVDLGYYFRRRPGDYPKQFHNATENNLHYKAVWTMLRALAATRRMSGGAERIFISYKVQGWIYRWAKKRGVSKRTLENLFQYPRGSGAGKGFIRHSPGHVNHLHVRFKCPKRDRTCR